MDLIQYVVLNFYDFGFKHRFFRSLRIIFGTNLNIGNQMKVALKNVILTIPKILDICLLLIISLLTHTYLLWVLFKDR